MSGPEGTPQETNYADIYFGGDSLRKFGDVKIAFPEYPTDIQFLFVRHTAAEDVPTDLSQLARGSDAVLLEGNGWKPEHETTQNMLSAGNTAALQYPILRRSPFHAAVGMALLGAGVSIKYCDQPFTRKLEAQLAQLNEPTVFDAATTVDRAVMLMREKWHQTLRGALARDRYILKNIYGRISEVSPTAGRPTRALFMIGGAHLTLPYVLRQRIQAASLQDIHTVHENPVPKDRQIDMYRQFLLGEPLEEEGLLKHTLRSVLRDSARLPELESLSLVDTRELFADVILSPLKRHVGKTALDV